MSGNSNTRKRGRPTGKNRVPLTAEQRRARNAQYERERREEMADALSDLAGATDSSSDVPTSKLLRIAYKMIKKSQKPNKKRTAEKIMEQNKAIEDEIAKLEEQIKIMEIEDWLKSLGPCQNPIQN